MVLPVVVINLDRRPDRLQQIARRLDALGIAWRRVQACDASQISESDLARLAPAVGHFGPLSRGGRACQVSHYKAWREAAESPSAFTLILEDDAYLADDAAQFVNDDSWIPAGARLIQLEKHRRGASKVLIGKVLSTKNGRSVHRLYSFHAGTAAYLISRDFARAALKLCGTTRVAVDHVLFNPAVSSLSGDATVMIISPALATQEFYSRDSDISREKRPRPLSLRVKRALYEMRPFPEYVRLLVTGQAKVREIIWAANGPAVWGRQETNVPHEHLHPDLRL
jgi:glycosyl transferase, family 25